jgi:hypothetical protein
MTTTTLPMPTATAPGSHPLAAGDPDAERQAMRARLQRYRRRLELHIQAAAIRRRQTGRLDPEVAEMARAVIQAYGRIEADGGLWLTVIKQDDGDWALLTGLESLGFVRREPVKRGAATEIRRFVVALEPRQALRQKLVDRELAKRWERAEEAAFRWVVEGSQEDEGE